MYSKLSHFNLREVTAGMIAFVRQTLADRPRCWRFDSEDSAHAAGSSILLNGMESVVSAVSLDSSWISVSVTGRQHHSPSECRELSAPR